MSARDDWFDSVLTGSRLHRSRTGMYTPLFAAIAVMLLALLWALLIIIAEQVRFSVRAPSAKIGIETILALSSLFGALVLTLFPSEEARHRLRWVAGGFIVLGCGSLLFGYLVPLFTDTSSLSTSLYGSLLTRIVAGVMFSGGLLPTAPRPLTWSIGWVTGFLYVGGCTLVLTVSDRFPVLTRVDISESASVLRRGILPGLTPLYWLLAVLPLVLTFAAVIGAARHYPGRTIGGWLVIAMALLVGAHTHSLFWPSGFSPVVTTASMFRLAFVAVVVAGAAQELKRISRDREAVLAATHEAARQAADLVRLKSDISRMVAHELASPLAAINRLADIAAIEPLQPQQALALSGIQEQARALDALVEDVRAMAVIEDESFVVRLRPVSCDEILTGAADFARSLSDNHPLSVISAVPDHVRVLADPDRIEQVLRNLLLNASQYSPHGALIELRADPHDSRVRFEVRDQGSGIEPADLQRIFEKFERGRGRPSTGVTGIGVGLYLSQRIIEAHRSTLGVQSTPGQGSTFWFSLDVISIK